MNVTYKLTDRTLMLETRRFGASPRHRARGHQWVGVESKRLYTEGQRPVKRTDTLDASLGETLEEKLYVPQAACRRPADHL
jgi:hypothetical protein